jgi:hypothetical protein
VSAFIRVMVGLLLAITGWVLPYLTPPFGPVWAAVIVTLALFLVSLPDRAWRIPGDTP